jgi:hypothetical protein
MIIATRAATSSSSIANIAPSHVNTVSACWPSVEQIVDRYFFSPPEREANDRLGNIG